MTHRSTFRGTAVLLTFLLPPLLFAACDGGGSSPTEPTNPPAVTAPPPATTTARTVEFQGRVVVASTSGRRLELASGTVVSLRADTAFDATGDLLSARAIPSALAAGRVVRVEGDGVRRDDGSIRARAIKVETD
ncbi:MAG: hypothetical protein R2991_07765 [Thermoanaerobaculia bacterium]